MTDNEPTPAPTTHRATLLECIWFLEDQGAFRFAEAVAAALRTPAPARSPADELHAETERLREQDAARKAAGVFNAAESQLLWVNHADRLDAALAAREGAHPPHEEKDLNGHQGNGSLPAVAPVIDGESK